MTTFTIPTNARVQGNLEVTGDMPLIPVTRCVQRNLSEYAIPWEVWRVWDAFGTNLPATPATDDLGLVGGTFATSSPSIQTEDLKAAGSTNKYARASIVIPAYYEAGMTIQLVINAGMLTTIADTTCTLNVAAYKSDAAAGIGSNLYAGAAQDIRSLTLAEKTFALTPTTLVAGDVLDVRLHIIVNDAATATAVKAIIGEVVLQCDTR